MPLLHTLGRWARMPWWTAAILTGAKSFADNPVLGSRRLNRAGLHAWRVRAAHRMADWRRRRIGRSLDPALRAQFDRDGFIVVPEALPPEAFEALRDALFAEPLPCRVHQQGDTLTRRVLLDPPMLRRFPALRQLMDGKRWRDIMAYVASTRARPLYYLQTIAGGVAEGPPDPQLDLHSDTFHPSLKAWLFLTDVADDGRPLTYVAGSHRATPERLAWEQARSISVLDGGDRISQRGSFRVGPEELPGLGLPPPTRFAVSANTLVAADTYGLHARGDSDRETLRIELWAYARRSPFLPWIGAGLTRWHALADRRSTWLASLIDALDRRGRIKQHWRSGGERRLSDRT